MAQGMLYYQRKMQEEPGRFDGSAEGEIALADNRKYSIGEIADICGVSKATVSRVINGNPRGVGEETRSRVLKVIEELNYRPNALARSVATARSGMVGLIVPDVSNFFYPKIIRGVMDYMDTKGYSVIVGNSDYNPEQEARQLLNLIDKRVDGIILCSGVSNKDFLKEFRKYQVPIGLIGRSFDVALSDVSISGDNLKGGYKSAGFLLNRGHKRIVFVEGKFSVSGGAQRLDGYRKAHAEACVPVRPELLMEGDYTIEFGRQAVRELLEKQIEFDAVMTGSDLIAIGMVSELQANGIRVPEDVELLGYDNIELAALNKPPLSTVSKPHYDMAQFVAEQLVKVIEGEPVRLPHMLLEPQLVLRQTTR